VLTEAYGDKLGIVHSEHGSSMDLAVSRSPSTTYTDSAHSETLGGMFREFNTPIPISTADFGPRTEARRCGICYFELDKSAEPIETREICREATEHGGLELQPFDLNAGFPLGLPDPSDQNTTIASLEKSVRRGCQKCSSMRDVLFSCIPESKRSLSDPLTWNPIALWEKASPYNMVWSFIVGSSPGNDGSPQRSARSEDEGCREDDDLPVRQFMSAMGDGYAKHQLAFELFTSNPNHLRM
jgi:hypothetical protein